VEKDALGPHLLEDLKLTGFDPRGPWRGSASVIVTRANFGCGSSREHAPWALEVNGITAVIAEGFARIFRQNMFNGGMPAIELPPASIDELFAAFASAASPVCEIDFDAKKLLFSAAGKAAAYSFALRPFDEALVRAGGWLEFADRRY
jgi:3-isopropylmalate/(R)-2-methylmalate dehydratase small subunit